MSIQEIMAKIADPAQPERDLIVDDLRDGLEDGRFDAATSDRTVLKLIDFVQSEPDALLHASILDLLAGYYTPGGSCSSEIEAFVVAQMSTFSVASLSYALGIVDESELEAREEILSHYAQSDNPATQESANYYLTNPVERYKHREGLGPST